jgi:tellurite resistance protein TerC
MPESVGSPALWVGFTLFILAMLAVDLGLHRKAHVYFWFGAQSAMEFLTGYLIEKALSVDNVFVFLVIFSYFAVPPRFQHRVLFWGVLGAIVLRAIFIALGAALLYHFHWILYLFGAFLVFTGIRLLREPEGHADPAQNPVVKLFRRFVPMAPDYEGQRFFVVREGKRLATPLLLVLVVVEATDVVFAVDSIPAIFAITRDPFIVYTSNIFAILGLRAMYFLLAGVIDRFHLLKVALGLVLAFVGTKMLISDFYKVPVGVSLGVVATLLLGSVIASLLFPPAPRPRADRVLDTHHTPPAPGPAHPE